MVDREKEVYKGRKVRLYKCRLLSATLRFSNGRFAVRFDCEDNGGDAQEPIAAPESQPEQTPPAD